MTYSNDTDLLFCFLIKADSVLKDKETVSGNVKEQAEKLKAKAMKLAEDASVKFSTLRGKFLLLLSI